MPTAIVTDPQASFWCSGVDLLLIAVFAYLLHCRRVAAGGAMAAIFELLLNLTLEQNQQTPTVALLALNV